MLRIPQGRRADRFVHPCILEGCCSGGQAVLPISRMRDGALTRLIPDRPIPPIHRIPVLAVIAQLKPESPPQAKGKPVKVSVTQWR